MKKFIVAVMLVMLLPMSANAQVPSPEVQARIKVLMALVVKLQAQLVELRAQEERGAKDDKEERCEDATEELADAEGDLEAYAAETRELQRKAVVGSNFEQALRIRAKIDRDREAGYETLRNEVTDKSEAVADNCG